MVTIHKSKGIIESEIILPASKSISNRALIMRYLSGDKLQLNNLSQADDTQLMVTLLTRVEKQKGSETPIPIDCQNAGTVARFLTALLAIIPGKWLMTGSGRMKERPIGILVESLKQLGAKIEYKEKNGFLPLLIEGNPMKGGEIEIDSSVSSQFITALLIIAPTMEDGLNIKLKGEITSIPYIEMTLKMLRQFGINASFVKDTIRIGQQEIKTGELTIEPDWTSASYWYEIAAFAVDVHIFLKDLQKNSLQGDAILPSIFKQFGVKTEYLADGIKLTKSGEVASEFTFDFTQCPDLAQAVIVTCAGLNISGIYTGLDSLRLKETDRIQAMYIELNKLGIKIKTNGQSELRIQNTELRTQITESIKTYSDHRMAMAFAPLAMIYNTIQIENPEVVSKSYPGYWEDLRKAGFILTD